MEICYSRSIKKEDKQVNRLIKTYEQKNEPEMPTKERNRIYEDELNEHAHPWNSIIQNLHNKLCLILCIKSPQV